MEKNKEITISYDEADKQLEVKINNFMDKNDGNCYILIYDKKTMLIDYTEKLIKKCIKDSIKIMYMKDKNVLKYSKSKILFIDIKENEHIEKIVKKNLFIQDFPSIIKIKDYDVVNMLPFILYIDE